MNASSMDDIYRYQRHIYDFTRKYYLLGRDQLIADLDVPAGGTVIEVGCGTGRNLIEIARAFPNAQLFGIDISAEMLATARSSIARAGLTHRISLAVGDATDFDAEALFHHADFDRVVMSYTLSMIPEWKAALDKGASIIGPNGSLQLVDFGQQEGLPHSFRKLLFAWLARFDVEPRAELPTWLEYLATYRGLRSVFSPQLRGYVWRGMLSRLR